MYLRAASTRSWPSTPDEVGAAAVAFDTPVSAVNVLRKVADVPTPLVKSTPDRRLLRLLERSAVEPVPAPSENRPTALASADANSVSEAAELSVAEPVEAAALDDVSADSWVTRACIEARESIVTGHTSGRVLVGRSVARETSDPCSPVSSATRLSC
ncbi:FAD-linked oxidase C-terminal domain-containing protein [Demequina capsici]|uniref:FAD-linked oxidase C-terminal domain-containing protein n=1 Tax=Demequina capsici TaxID=3075620 RepID=UPI003F689893